MKKVYYFIILIVLVCVPFVGSAQKKSEVVPQRGPEEFPQLEFTNIPGAPQLSAPVLITGTELPVVAQGMGLAAPAFYDWDGDGLKDLLIGEFGTGVENSSMVGSFIRVYKNSGSESTPSFTGRWEYAKPNFIFNDRSGGTPFSVPQGCCIGTHPQFTDINCDGQADMVSGSYDGGVYVFYGTKEGFLPSEALRQAGDPYSRAPGWQSMQEYWLYSSASFGDLTGDGLPDLILGGTSLRISKNIGTAARPFFGTRDTLRLTDGNPLKVHEYTAAEMKAFEPYIKDFGMVPPAAGSNKICPYVVDWDGDGVLDILTTNEYTAEGLNTVDFFKGVKAGKDTRFLPAVTLFRAKDGGKAFPGSGPKISYVTGTVTV